MAGKRKRTRPAPPGRRSLTTVARAALRKRLRNVARYLRLAARKPNEDAEYVHQVRVWSRRSGVAVKLFGELLKRKQRDWFRKHLKQIRLAADLARDCDVMMIQLTGDPAGQRVLEQIRQHRQEAQEPIVEIDRRMTAKSAFQKHTAALLASLTDRSRKTVRKQKPLTAWAARALSPTADEFFAAGAADLSSAEGLHRLRIQAKKFRYAMELLFQAFPAEFEESAYPAVKEIQTRLGEINDAAVAAERFQNWVQEAASPAEADYFRMLAEREAATFAQRRERFLTWWSDSRRERLHRQCQKLLSTAATPRGRGG